MALQHSGGACRWCRANVPVIRHGPPHVPMVLALVASLILAVPLGLVTLGLFWIVPPAIVALWIFLALFGSGPWLCTRCGRDISDPDTVQMKRVALGVAVLAGIMALAAVGALVFIQSGASRP